MTDLELEAKLRALVKKERQITDEILTLLREADARKLYLERGFPNMYEWLIRGFDYSRGAAHRRISAARLSAAVPEAREMLMAGTLSLSTASQLQSTMRKEERRTGQAFTSEQKQEFTANIGGKSSETVQFELARLFPEQAVRKETVRAINAEEAKVTLVLEAEALAALRRVQEMLSHARPGAGLAEVVGVLAQEYLQRKDPREEKREKASGAGLAAVVKGEAKVKATTMTKKPDANAGRVNARVRKEILRKAGGRCEFTDPVTGQVCGSAWQVEVDHRLPRALGGGNETSNLRCLCRAHNQQEAEKFLNKKGKAKKILVASP